MRKRSIAQDALPVRNANGGGEIWRSLLESGAIQREHYEQDLVTHGRWCYT